MKKNVKIIFFLLIICMITLISSLLLNVQLLKERKIAYASDFPDGSTIAIMVYDENVGDYINCNEIPKGLYKLNDDKTRCVGPGKISKYNAIDGTINYNFEAADECYIYFDTIYYFSDYIKALYTTDGANNLYLHDGIGTYANASLEIGDNSLRYSGANADNFVCFGEDCSDFSNLYRVIGVFEGKVKLVKADYINSDILGTNGTYNSITYTGPSYPNYSGKMTTINRYYWGNHGSTWQNSTLNQQNLNNNYLGKLADSWKNMIADTNWIISGAPYLKTYESNAKRVYDYEISDSCAECTNKANKQLSTPSKIGLMYLSDYMYAASPEKWTLLAHDDNDANKDYRNAIDSNWMYLGLPEWTISRCSDYSNNSFRLASHGSVYYDLIYNIYYPLRPVFYLKEDVKYYNGNGTKETPYNIIQ